MQISIWTVLLTAPTSTRQPTPFKWKHHSVIPFVASASVQLRAEWSIAFINACHTRPVIASYPFADTYSSGNGSSHCRGATCGNLHYFIYAVPVRPMFKEFILVTSGLKLPSHWLLQCHHFLQWWRRSKHSAYYTLCFSEHFDKMRYHNEWGKEKLTRASTNVEKCI